MVLIFKSGTTFTEAHGLHVPEEAKSTRRCSHISERHSSLQSNEGDLEKNQQVWLQMEKSYTWNRLPVPSAVTSG